MTPEDDSLGFMAVYASMYSTHINSPVVPLLEWLKEHGLGQLTICPGCGLEEFKHVEGCQFIARLELVMADLRQSIEDGGRPDLLMKERQVKKVKLT